MDINNNMLELVEDILRKDERLVSGDTLLKNKIMELTYKLDEKLIDLLLSNERVKDYFFKNVNNTLIFDKDKFVKFVSNKNFLPDSYTHFKNIIGLTTNDKYLINIKEVCLSWPYKDCILEGEQTKPSEQRDEIFWNDILAPNEIDRLTETKVLTNFKKVDKNGVNKSPVFNPKANLLIKGNNLLALHSLKEKYRDSVKLIYIDPPYNTGNDEFNYNDKFNHSTWLTFMKNRLEVAKELLCSEGVIVVQCDDNEQAYLKVLMDEIFKRDNFINSVSVKMGNLSGPKMSHVEKRLPKLKEYLLFYKKSNEFSYNIVKKKVNKWNPEYNRFLTNFSYDDYKLLKSLQAEQNIDDEDVDKLNSRLKDTKIKNVREIFEKKDILDIDKWKKENAYRIVRKHSGPSFKELAERKKLYKKEQEIAAIKSKNKVYLSITDYNRKADEPRMQIVFSKDHLEKPIGDMWLDINTSGFQNQGGVKLKNGKKPEELLERIISLTTDKDDLVLDFFLGSGTTAAVAHKMNRNYIGVEQINYGKNDSYERLINVIEGDETGISQKHNWQGGGSFIFAELMEMNQKYISKIQESDYKETLLDIWKEMKKKAFLSYKVNPNKIDENVEEFKDLSLEDMKKFLLEILDKNHLYVNYSEINDKQYNISEEVKELNKKFYEGDLNA